MEALYQPGDTIKEKYRIVGILGEGGTAITYEAIDLTQEISVAIKVLSLQQTRDWKLVELFEREAKVLKNLNHSRIPSYLDYFFIDTQSDRQFFLVQEIIPGKSLATLVEQGWYFQQVEVKNIAQQVLEILSYLHSLQPPVIHRDIKPHNIIRSDTGEIYLVDLGAVQDVYRNTLTRGATFVGTIDYMPPEQLRGHANFASDLYSLGCTLLYLLTRRSPSELPLQRMKINFRSSLNIDVQFANWLDIILEPALEDRFSSSTAALENLLKNNFSTFKFLAGSALKIKTSLNNIIIIIPPPGMFENEDIPLVSSILCVFTIGPLLNLSLFDNLIFFVVQLFFWTFVVLPIVFQRFVLTTNIEINRKEFHLEFDYIIASKSIKGLTRHIKSIKLKERSNFLNLQSIQTCCIFAGVKQHQFGKHLTKSEKRWLIKEIYNFLGKINH